MKEITEGDKMNWIMVRNGEVTNIFKDRRDAVKHFKELLEQTLKDFKNQDKNDEYSYSIELPKIEIKPVGWRKSYLGL